MTSPQSQQGRDPVASIPRRKEKSADSQDLSQTGNRSGQHLLTGTNLSRRNQQPAKLTAPPASASPLGTGRTPGAPGPGVPH